MVRSFIKDYVNKRTGTKVVAESSYFLGHLTSRLMNFVEHEKLNYECYKIYQKLMVYSCNLSDKYDLGIWSKPVEEKYK